MNASLRPTSRQILCTRRRYVEKVASALTMVATANRRRSLSSAGPSAEPPVPGWRYESSAKGSLDLATAQTARTAARPRPARTRHTTTSLITRHNTPAPEAFLSFMSIPHRVRIAGHVDRGGSLSDPARSTPRSACLIQCSGSAPPGTSSGAFPPGRAARGSAIADASQSNKVVLMYRSAVSGNTTTISFPAFSSRPPTSTAAIAAAPEDIPAKIPSCRASFLAMSNASPFAT